MCSKAVSPHQLLQSPSGQQAQEPRKKKLRSNKVVVQQGWTKLGSHRSARHPLWSRMSPGKSHTCNGEGTPQTDHRPLDAWGPSVAVGAVLGGDAAAAVRTEDLLRAARGIGQRQRFASVPPQRGTSCPRIRFPSSALGGGTKSPGPEDVSPSAVVIFSTRCHSFSSAFVSAGFKAVRDLERERGRGSPDGLRANGHLQISAGRKLTFFTNKAFFKSLQLKKNVFFAVFAIILGWFCFFFLKDFFLLTPTQIPA